MQSDGYASMPDFGTSESLDVLVRRLHPYFVKGIEAPHTFEELRTTRYGGALRPLVRHLSRNVHHPAIVHALLALNGHFAEAEADDDRGIYKTRGLACELVAWRFISHLSEREAIDCLCYEVPEVKDGRRDLDDVEGTGAGETTPLLPAHDDEADATHVEEDVSDAPLGDSCYAAHYAGLSALEIAAVTDSKKFLSQQGPQRIIQKIWRGDITFWRSMSQRSSKQARIYSTKSSDPYCRLRVPLYLKCFEVMFFAAFLVFYYMVLVEKSVYTVTSAEILLYVWLASFAYNELGEVFDAGLAFYSTDFWSWWDIGIIATGLAFFVCRVIGLQTANASTIDTAFDILALEALFLVPRICSLLSLHPYFGTLIPCLKEMTKDFLKFIQLIVVLYAGFNTTFVFLARGTFSYRKMSWILIKVFFGSSYLGFDVAEQISPVLGPPLMFVFVCLTNILLVTSLISLLSNSLDRVMDHAREEFLFVSSVYVLEASTSNRLTYFIPPLNLISLVFRPMRLFVTADHMRACRIALLKATHWPFVALILGYESLRHFLDRRPVGSTQPEPVGPSSAPSLLRRPKTGMFVPSQLAAAGTRHSPLDRQARAASHGAIRKPPPAVETTDALKALAAGLRSQLEAVTSMIEREEARKVAPSG